MALDSTYGRLEWKAHFTYKDVQKHWRKTNQLDVATWKLLNRKANAHIYIVVSDEASGNIKGLTNGHEVWSK